MSISPVKIGNMALSNIGSGSTIESMDENSIEAKQIKLWYDFARKQALSALDWNFARKRLVLATHSDDAPELEWAFRYQYPVDALVIRRLVNPSGPKAKPVPYVVENSADGAEKTILTNLEEAEAVYTFDNTNTIMYSADFVNAFAFLLATYISFILTSKRSIKSDNMQLYVNTLRLAQAHNANEKVDDEPKDADWISGRA